MRYLFIAVLLLSLGACVRPLPIELEFNTAPQILRGQWLATQTPDDLSLSSLNLLPASVAFEPTYIDEKHYSVTGVWETGDGQVFELTGDVYGDRVTYLQPQTSPMFPESGLIAELRRGGELVTRLCAIEGGTNISFRGYMNPKGDYSVFSNDNSIKCNGKAEEGFLLNRSD